MTTATDSVLDLFGLAVSRDAQTAPVSDLFGLAVTECMAAAALLDLFGLAVNRDATPAPGAIRPARPVTPRARGAGRRAAQP